MLAYIELEKLNWRQSEQVGVITFHLRRTVFSHNSIGFNANSTSSFVLLSLLHSQFSFFPSLSSFSMRILPVFRISKWTNELQLLFLCLLGACILFSKPCFCYCCLCRRSCRSVHYSFVFFFFYFWLFSIKFANNAHKERERERCPFIRSFIVLLSFSFIHSSRYGQKLKIMQTKESAKQCRPTQSLFILYSILPLLLHSLGPIL